MQLRESFQGDYFTPVCCGLREPFEYAFWKTYFSFRVVVLVCLVFCLTEVIFIIFQILKRVEKAYFGKGTCFCETLLGSLPLGDPFVVRCEKVARGDTPRNKHVSEHLILSCAAPCAVTKTWRHMFISGNEAVGSFSRRLCCEISGKKTA